MEMMSAHVRRAGNASMASITSNSNEHKFNNASNEKMVAAAITNTSLLVALAALQQCLLADGFQAPAVPIVMSRNRRSLSSSSSAVILEMTKQRKSVLGGTTVVEVDHTPVVPQDESSSSSPLSYQQQGREPTVLETKAVVDTAAEATEEKDPTKKMLQQIKDAGVAGVISYALWELGFWSVSIPLTIFGYYEVTGHWPDLSDKEDVAKLSAEAFAFVNFARFAVPLRIGTCTTTYS
jgi:hypothetical protein